MQSGWPFADCARFQEEHDPVFFRLRRESLCKESTIIHRLITKIQLGFQRVNTNSPSAESRKFGFMAHLRGTAETCLVLIFDY